MQAGPGQWVARAAKRGLFSARERCASSILASGAHHLARWLRTHKSRQPRAQMADSGRFFACRRAPGSGWRGLQREGSSVRARGAQVRSSQALSMLALEAAMTFCWPSSARVPLFFLSSSLTFATSQRICGQLHGLVSLDPRNAGIVGTAASTRSSAAKSTVRMIFNLLSPGPSIVRRYLWWPPSKPFLTNFTL